MAITIATKVANSVKTHIDMIAKEQEVTASEVIRTCMYLGYKQMLNQPITNEIKERYEKLRVAHKLEMIKGETNILASNAHFVRRSARMLLNTHATSPKLAQEMYTLLEQEAELRGMLTEFHDKIPKNFDKNMQTKSVMLQEAKEAMQEQRAWNR